MVTGQGTRAPLAVPLPGGVPTGLGQQQLAKLVRGLLESELAVAPSAAPHIHALHRYYKHFLTSDGRVLYIAVRAYVARLWPLVECLLQAPRPVRLLDAGCGYGTEAYLAALLGAEVTGVDLVPERIAVAEARREFFQSQARDALQIEFEAANVLRFLACRRRYDLMWAMEAISHIHPPEAFLRAAFAALRPGGALIVSDPNRANPLAYLRSVAIRGSLRPATHQKFHDPETGQPVDYGQEHIVSTSRIGRALRQVGFVVERIVMSGFMATTVLPSTLLRRPACEVVLSRFGWLAARLPGVRRLGTVYAVVARKAVDP